MIGMMVQLENQSWTAPGLMCSTGPNSSPNMHVPQIGKPQWLLSNLTPCRGRGATNHACVWGAITAAQDSDDDMLDPRTPGRPSTDPEDAEALMSQIWSNRNCQAYWVPYGQRAISVFLSFFLVFLLYFLFISVVGWLGRSNFALVWYDRFCSRLCSSFMTPIASNRLVALNVSYYSKQAFLNFLAFAQVFHARQLIEPKLGSTFHFWRTVQDRGFGPSTVPRSRCWLAWCLPARKLGAGASLHALLACAVRHQSMTGVLVPTFACHGLGSGYGSSEVVPVHRKLLLGHVFRTTAQPHRIPSCPDLSYTPYRGFMAVSLSSDTLKWHCPPWGGIVHGPSYDRKARVAPRRPGYQPGS